MSGPVQPVGDEDLVAYADGRRTAPHGGMDLQSVAVPQVA